MKTSRQRRISRALFTVLGITLTLGLVFWLHNVSKNAAVRAALAAAKAQPSSATAPVQSPSLAQPEKTEPKTLVLQTPAAPVTPVTPVAAAPTTKPAQVIEPVILAAATTAPTITATHTQAAAQRSAAADASNKKPATQPQLDALLCGTSAMMQLEDMLQARRALNTALISNTLSPADAAKAKQQLNEMNAKVVFSTQHIDDGEFITTYKVPGGAVLSKIASSHEVTPEILQRINGISDPRKLRADQNIKMLKGPFHAAVFKKDFRLEIWLGGPYEKGSMYITSFPVGLGKDDSTPTGAWAIGTKLKNPAYYSPRGEGVIAPDDPNNPLGEYWISLTGTNGQAVGKTSYGIHGTIHPESIGKQESMGCIRMKNEDAGLVYELLVEGQSTVVVKD